MTTDTSKITAEIVRNLREVTGAGMMTCKEALTVTNGNFDEAIKYLRQKGVASADKKLQRKAKEGIIEAYLHTGSRLGVLLELNCETDFVARRSEFKELAKNLAMQIASCPTVKYVSLNDIPESFKQEERIIEMQKQDILNKPENIREQIVTGRIEKTLKEFTLLNQQYIKDSNITIEELIKQNIALLGENIQIARFIKFNLGETNS
jgi:elongation factor Ts